MKNSKQFLIILALSLSIILIINFLMFSYLHPARLQRPDEALVSTIEETKVSLYFSPPIVTGKRVRVPLILNPQLEKIVALDIMVAFNPEVLFFVDFEPGEVFETPILLKKEFNQNQGRLRFALASQTPFQQEGVVANLIFTTQEESVSPIEIEIIEKESNVSALNKTGNVLGKSTKLLYYPDSQ